MTGLRVLRAVAERGSFTGAAAELGYTQSAVSRQVAALERASGVLLVERQRQGVRLTPAGRVLLRHAATALDALDAAEDELRGRAVPSRSVRIGAFPAAGPGLLAPALAALADTHPSIRVTTRDGSSPSLVKALRARSLDLAVLALSPPFRQPDRETPALRLHTLAESELLVAVPAQHPLARQEGLTLADLHGRAWVASRSGSEEELLGVWPGLPGRHLVTHTARDWLAKLHLVAAGGGLTTVASVLTAVVPDGVRLLAVQDGPRELRRIVAASLPDRSGEAISAVVRALVTAAK